jgi:hypothetical protein
VQVQAILPAATSKDGEKEWPNLSSFEISPFFSSLLKWPGN